MSKRPTPPLPQKLQELLNDYPEDIAQLQALLNLFAVPKPRLQPFDEAIWLLQDGLDSLLHTAQDELTAAEASGDAAAIEKARAKKAAMLRAQPSGLPTKHFGTSFKRTRKHLSEH